MTLLRLRKTTKKKKFRGLIVHSLFNIISQKGRKMIDECFQESCKQKIMLTTFFSVQYELGSKTPQHIFLKDSVFSQSEAFPLYRLFCIAHIWLLCTNFSFCPKEDISRFFCMILVWVTNWANGIQAEVATKSNAMCVLFTILCTNTVTHLLPAFCKYCRIKILNFYMHLNE